MLVEPQAPYSEVSLTQISTSACFSCVRRQVGVLC